LGNQTKKEKVLERLKLRKIRTRNQH